ncbi:tetratricopeptide repeat protein [Novosphingobium pokkalii]|uniref:tetratricopeptide repeat protein n=1 Tax=Novosphingobium pokkalii TaxID=1770194 RepID=UPI0036385681
MLVREQFGLRAALPWFEQGLKIHPQDPDLLAEYAATLGDMGQARAMLVVVRKLAEVDPGNVRALYFQAVLAARAGKTDLARTILQRTGTALRDMPAAMLLGGVLEYRAGNLSVAAGLIGRLVRMQPDNLMAQQLLARIIAREGDLRQVAVRWDGVARQPFAPPYLQTVVARAWQKLGQAQRARDLNDLALARGGRPFTAIRPICRSARWPCAIRMAPISRRWLCPMCAGCWRRGSLTRRAASPIVCARPIPARPTPGSWPGTCG